MQEIGVLEVHVSLSLLAMIIGIFGAVMILLIIFSLLSLAQQGDAHLDQMSLGEARGWLENRPTGVGEAAEKSP